MSDLDAFIVAAVDDGELFYGCAVNPDIACHLWRDPSDSPPAPPYEGLEALFSPSERAPTCEDLALKRTTTAPDSRCRALLCEACRPLNPAQPLLAFGPTLTGTQEPFDST
jgi:hypothetical protein